MKLVRIHFGAPIEFAGTAFSRILCDRDEYRTFSLDYDEDHALVVIRKEGAATRVLVPLTNVRAMETEEPAGAVKTMAGGDIKVHRTAPAKQ